MNPAHNDTPFSRIYSAEASAEGWDMRRALLFALPFVLILGVIGYVRGVSLANAEQPVYSVKAVIMPLEGRSVSLIATMEKNMLSEILKSNDPARLESVSGRRIRNVLLSDNFNIKMVEKYNLLPVLFPQPPRSLQTAEKQPVSAQPSVWTGARKLLSQLTVEPNAELQTLKIEYADADPTVAYTMVQRYLREIDRHFREDLIRKSQQNENYLNALSESAQDKDWASRIRQVAQGQSERAMYAQLADAFLFEVVDAPIFPEAPFVSDRYQIIKQETLNYLLIGLLIGLLLDFLHVQKLFVRIFPSFFSPRNVSSN